MLKHLPLALTAAVVISMTAIASVAALDDDTPTPTPAETPEITESPAPTPSPEVTPAPEPEELDTADDADDEGEDETGATEDGETEDPNHAAQAIADTFGVPVEEVMALHDQGIGFGALFKLYKLALCKGVDINDLIPDIEEEGGGWAFGKRFGELTDEEKAQCEELPKNLGQSISGHQNNSEAADDTDDESDDSALEDSARSSKHSSGHGRGHH